MMASRPVRSANAHSDFPHVAKSMGADGYTVRHAGELLALKEQIAGRTGPVLIDVQIDTSVLMPKRDRIGSMKNVGSSNEN